MEDINIHILDPIPYQADTAAMLKHLRIKAGSAAEREFLRLLDEASKTARPRAVYRAAYITGRGEDWVEIDGQHFTSRVLRVNLENAYRVFPYLVTCGPELQSWANQYDDMLLKYWAEAIKESALRCAMPVLLEDLHARFHPGHTASMNPGSLTDWPIQEQRVLFDLLGPAAGAIGVCLTDSMLMVPTKSVSGIHFPTEADFESCQLCPRADCPGRRAPYDKDLFAERYSLPE